MKVLDTAAYVGILQTLVEDGKEASVVVAGGSMSPFLCDKRDTILFSAPDETAKPLSRGDMVFYRRATPEDDRYVMHRIYRCDDDGTYTLLGDAQTVPEPGIRREQIFARVTRVRRRGKWIDEHNLTWKFFAHVWILPCIVTHRRCIIHCYTKLKHVFRR